jgi:hypothetical protein
MDETYQLLLALNKIMRNQALPDSTLKDSFTRHWPALQRTIRRMLLATPIAPTHHAISQVKKRQILGKMRQLVRTLAIPLKTPVENLNATVFVPAFDSNLYVVPGLDIRGLAHFKGPTRIRVPFEYGATGTAFKYREEQIVVFPQDGQKVSFTLGSDDTALETQKKARQFLLPLETSRVRNIKWIISIPIIDKKGISIAVLNVTTTQATRKEEKLREAFTTKRMEIFDIRNDIATLLE